LALILFKPKRKRGEDDYHEGHEEREEFLATEDTEDAEKIFLTTDPAPPGFS